MMASVHFAVEISGALISLSRYQKMSCLKTLHASAKPTSPPTSAPRLIGQAYEAADPEVRAKIVSTLMQPLGMLSLASIAHGIFATIRIRIGGCLGDVTPQDIESIHARDVVILAKRTQKVDPEVIEEFLHHISLGNFDSRLTGAAGLRQ